MVTIIKDFIQVFREDWKAQRFLKLTYECICLAVLLSAIVYVWQGHK